MSAAGWGTVTVVRMPSSLPFSSLSTLIVSTSSSTCSMHNAATRLSQRACRLGNYLMHMPLHFRLGFPGRIIVNEA